MATFTTQQLELPDEILQPWLGKVKYGSVIAALSNSMPMLFGKGHSMTFDIGEAEYVGEGVNKSGSTITPKIVRTAPFKFQKTVRWTDEVQWADEDTKVDVIRQVLDLIQPALSRALDYGIIHGINPSTGATVSAMTQKLTAATNIVVKAGTDKPYVPMDAADALVLASRFVPSEFALDPSLAAQFAAQRAIQTEQRLYPDFQLSTTVSNLDGHRASVSNTVGATGVAAADSLLLGIIGQFNAVQWGIQRAIGISMIPYGDPDGGGDLKRNNQVAFRAEVVYGWGIADLDAFALIKSPTPVG